MGLFDFFKKKTEEEFEPKQEGRILPDKGRSYVVDANGEPMIVFP